MSKLNLRAETMSYSLKYGTRSIIRGTATRWSVNTSTRFYFYYYWGCHYFY